MEYFRPPVKLACLSIAKDETRRLFKNHDLVGVVLYDYLAELKGPGIICYCRCKEHTKDPLVVSIPLQEVVVFNHKTSSNKENYAKAN